MTIANMPNLGVVEAMGKQFNTNIFEGIAKKANKVGKNLSQTGGAARITNVGGFNYRSTSNPSGPRQPAGALGPAPTRAVSAPRQPIAAIGAGSRSPISTPYQAPARTFAMSGGVPATKLPFSSSPQSHTPVNRTHFGAPTTPGFSAPPAVHNATQFSNVTPQSNAPYPTHQHPAGSSTTLLPNLTAAQPKPNQFTVGSRNIKGGGIAAMGSQLESKLMTNPINTPAKKRRV